MGRRSTPVLLLVMACAAAQAQDAGAALAPLTALALKLDIACCSAPPGWKRIDAGALDAMRGGFTSPGGLSVSLGIERMVSINGELVARTNFQIANVGTISSDEARHAHQALSAINLVQNGANNYAVGAALSATRGTFVQNSLDGQAISSQTIISSSVNSASLLKDMHFQSGLRDAAIRAIGSR